MISHLRLKAYGKINLGLDVLGKREDGYHQVRMIMQTVGLHDSIDIYRKARQGIAVESNLYYLPNNEQNLAYRAAALLMEEFGVDAGLSIRLRKFIPVSAGMAGGSSDAAAVLFGVNKMFGLGLSKEQLMERGLKLGADVPYCLMRGTALSEGIGGKTHGSSTDPPVPGPHCQAGCQCIDQNRIREPGCHGAQGRRSSGYRRNGRGNPSEGYPSGGRIV